MQQYRKNLGKVSLTAEGAWDLNNSYDVLGIVYDEHTQHGFISRKAVPQGVDLYNKEYWMPLNVSGYADNNVIILSKKTSEASIQSYTLEEAIASIKSVGRRPGAILGFYNENNDRLDIGGRWELWQFNDTNVYNWENVDSWQNLYYNYNKFMGWFKDENFLTKYAPFPEIGCYAFVGSEFNEATVYRCDNKYVWNNTTQHAWDYVKVIVDGNVTVGENGNWFNNGEDTGIPASVKGENGKTPVFREKDNTIQYSFDNINWITISNKLAAWFRWNATTGDTQANNVGRIQISRDNVTWTNLSGDIINNLHISRYIGADETLPTSGIAEGTIYAKGPTYADGDTSHANPIYRLWVYAWKDNTLAWQDNGEFTSIAAGVVQEMGGSETEVMSQKAVTREISDLGAETYNLDVEINGGEKIHKMIRGNGTDIFIPLSDLRTTKFIVQYPPTNFKQYGLATSTNGVDYIYTNVNWSDESNGIGSISFPSDTTHIVVTSVNKSGTIISFLDVNKDGLSALLEEEVESRKLEVNKIEDKIVTLSDEIYNANVEINGGRKIVKTILGNGTDIFIPLATLRTTDFVVKNPSANFKQYGLGLSSNGTNYVYKEITWLDESKGLGRIIFGADTTHVVVTSAVKDGTELIFLDVADNSSLKKELIKLNQRLFGGRIEVGKYEGNGTNIFINRVQNGLFDTKVYFYVKNPNAANFREYAFATSEDGVTLKLYQQVTWIDQAKGYGCITIDTDYLAISSVVKEGTEITFLSPDYNGEIEIFEHNAIVSFIDDDTGRYVPEIWGEIIRQTGIKMGFACVTGVISGKETALSDSYKPMTIDELRNLYNSGHEVYSHTWSHPACYSDDVTPAMLQEEFRKSKDWLNENGFTRNSEVLVYSGGLGENQTEKHNVARRHYKYGVDTVGGGINTEPLKNKLCIYRINADTFTLEELKAKVDKAISEKKLLVLMNHAYELNKDKDNQINKMISLINYIKTTNAIILPLHEALHQIYGW